jgi:branched-subunit amino acid transport protein
MERSYLLTVAGMALATYLPRAIPLLVLSRRPLPPWLRDWLDLVPAALLAALLAPVLLAGSEPRTLDLLRPELFAAVPTLAVALATRSLAWSVLAGMLSFWLTGLISG